MFRVAPSDKPDTDVSSQHPPAIAMQDVFVTLGEGVSRVEVLKGVSVTIPAGVAVGLVGPSGSGKSTLLMTAAGLESPDRGSVSIAGTEITRMSEDALAQFRGARIGIVFQAFHLIPTLTARENVAIPLELAGIPDAFAIAEAELAAVGLGARLGHYPGQLSGGEQQRVAIARALATRPAILVADEPTGNLDEATGKDIIDLLFALRQERGTTLLLVTHDMGLAKRCDRIIRLKAGRILEEAA